MNGSLLQLDRINKSFGAVRALDEVSFDLHAGEIHALIGENGAGKSTLIRIVAGAHQPDVGLIYVHGNHVANLTPAAAHRLGIACIYQQPALFPDLSVAENIGLRLEAPAPFRRINWRRLKSTAHDLLARVGSHIDPDSEIRELSMPEQQLVEIACAIGTGARIIIMDEPTSALTRKEQELLFAAARELRRSGAGVVYISHRLEEIFTLADRVTVLRDGKTVGTNRIEALNEPELIRMMVGREISQIFPPSQSGAGEVLLSMRNLGSSASGVRNVNLDVCTGEIVGLAGLVGAGRTELARIVFGITPADSGEILIKSKLVKIDSPRTAIEHGIGYVPEDRRRHGIIGEMTVAQNVSMAIHNRCFPGRWLRPTRERRLATGYIRELDIRCTGEDAPANALSGGNQQKVALARWLATDPRILVLDEPTQGVDVGAKAEIHRLIRALAAKGIAILMISSDLPEILGMSDRIAVMRAGSIVEVFDAKAANPSNVMAAALGQAR